MLVDDAAFFLPGRGREHGRLKVAYLSNQLPFPAWSGGQLREAQLLPRLATEADIDLLVCTQHFTRDVAHAQLAAKHCASVAIFSSSPSPASGPPANVPERVWQYECPTLTNYLRTLLRAVQHDMVHVEGYFLARYVPTALGVPVLLVEENIEHDLVHEQERLDQRVGASWRRSRAIEHQVWRRVSVCGATCQADVETMRREVPEVSFSLFANGFDHLRVRNAPRVHRRIGRDVLFVGNYSWEPTNEGARRLLERIWPTVVRANPTARLTLVGAGISSELHGLARRTPNVDVVGCVPSVLPFLEDADVFVCPIRMGTGTKVKMGEALTAGCAIVANRAALHGFPPAVQTAVLAADTDRETAVAVISLLRDAKMRSDLAQRALRFATTLTGWDEAAKMLMAGWRQACRTNSVARH